MYNFEDVIQTLIETNNKLICGEIDLKVAQQISQSTQVLINAARLQLDMFKANGGVRGFISEKAVEPLPRHESDDVVDCYDPTRDLF